MYLILKHLSVVRSGGKESLGMTAETKVARKMIELIEGWNFANVAMINPDGSPYVATMWVDHEADLVTLNTIVGRKKQKLLSRDPRVSIAINNSSNPHEAVFIQGKVVASVEGSEAQQHADRLAKKYLKLDRYPLPPGEKRITFKVRPTKITSWPPSS
jgi:PPOX class probable F420-dependent enzyme